MNVCDYCSKDCQNLEECLELSYNEMLRRCNVNIQEEPPERPEVSYKAKEGHLGEGIGFQRLRRITGYLTSDISTWNNAKRAELNDRVKHI